MSRRWKQVRHQLRRNRPAQFSLFVLFIFVIAALCAGLSPYDPDRMALGARTLPPDSAHWFGTDEYGRDYFTRALYGGQISLMVGFLAMLFSTLIGTVVGTVSGYFGGWLDNLMMRAVDILMAIPAFFLLLVVNAYLKPGVDEHVAAGARRNPVGERARVCALCPRVGGAPAAHYRSPHYSRRVADHYRGRHAQYRLGHSDGVDAQLLRAGRTGTGGVVGKHA